MKRARRSVCWVLYVFLLPIAASIGAQEPYTPPEEAPETLFEAQIGDAEVDLRAKIDWTISLLAGYGWGFSRDWETPQPTPFPNFVSGFVPNQVPDVTLSLWLYNRYFFEFSYTENPGLFNLTRDTGLNTFLLGYNGQPGEIVQSVRIGNTEADISDYSLVTVPIQPLNSFGASARLEGNRSAHELLVRYQPTEKLSKTYIGKNELTESFRELNEYRRGTMFHLPDRNVENLQVYIEDKTGTIIEGSSSRRYRPAEADDGYISSAEGIIRFDEQVKSRVLVYYEKDGSPVGSPSLGTGALAGIAVNSLADPTDDLIDPALPPLDFSWNALFSWGDNDYLGVTLADLEIVLDGRDCLLLYDPGTFSPFEHFGSYPVTNLPSERGNTAVFLSDKGNLDEDGTALPFHSFPAEDWIRLDYASADFRDPGNKYPLANRYPELYGPYQEVSSGDLPEKLLIRASAPTEGYEIDADAVEGSVLILINGNRTTQYMVNYDTGVIDFYRFIFPDDRVEIFYEVESTARGGSFLFAQGNRFTPAPGLEIEAATSVDWNVNSGDYTTEAWEKPGTILVAGSVEYSADNLDLSADAGLSFTTPNSTGILRILGMEEDAFTLSLDSETIFPSSTPDTSFGGLTLDSGSRGVLLYKNFFSSTSTLMPYDTPGITPSSYSSGNKIGPYTARTSGTDAISGEVMVMDFILGSASSWVGAQIPLDIYSGSLDLTDISSISFFWKTLEGSAGSLDDIDVYIQVGSIGEDLDGDTRLDEELSPDSQGFDFDDSASGYTFLLGGGPFGRGNGTLDSEDTNDNSVLDLDAPNLIETFGPYGISGGALPGDDWTLKTLTLDAAARNKLHTSSAVRIVVINSGSSSQDGRLLISDFSFAGSAFKVEPKNSGTITVHQITETEYWERVAPGDTAARNELTTSHPETAAVFHSGGEAQRFLEVDWSSVSPGEQVAVSGYTNELPVESYKNFNFYIRSPSLSDSAGTTATLKLTGSDGRGLTTSFPLIEYSSWQKITVDAANSRVQLGGSDLAGSSVSLEETSGTLSRFSFTITGSDSGTVHVDELHLENADIYAGFGFQGEVRYSYPDPVLSAGDIPLVEDISLEQSISAATRRFDAFYASGTSGGVRSSSRAAGDVLFTRLEMELGVQWNYEQVYLSGGHSITIPTVQSPVLFSDSYRETETDEGRSIARTNSLIISPVSWFTASGSHEASFVDPTLQQLWSGDAAFTIPSIFSLDFAVGLSQTGTGFIPFAGNYFSNWINNYLLFVPQKQDQYPDRTSSLSSVLDVPTRPAGFSFLAGLTGTVSGELPTIQKNDSEFSISVPVTLGSTPPGTIAVTPLYSRTGSTSATVTGHQGFREDFSYLFQDFGNQSYLFESAPWHELYADTVYQKFETATENLSKASYTPAFSLTLDRSFGSYLYDLFLPAKVSFSMNRNLSRSGDLIEDSNTYSGKLTWTALNLFGSLGAYRITSMYESEEISNSLEIELIRDRLDATTELLWIIQNYYLFEGPRETEFSIDHRLERTSGEETGWRDSLELEMLWKSPYDFSSVVLFKKIQEEPPVLEHIETFTFLYDSSSTPQVKQQFSITGGHKSGLVFPEIGGLYAQIALGFGRNTEEVYLLGIQGGIELELSF